MTPDELRKVLRKKKVDFEERPVKDGTQFRCSGGEIFVVYTTGTLSVQGQAKSSKLVEHVRRLSGKRSSAVQAEIAVEAKPEIDPEKQIFIVYGHDVAARESLELLLHRMDFEPIVLQNLPAQGDTIIEKLERYLGAYPNVGFACVLLTPDDEGHEAGKPEGKKYRARQNVVLELGMVLARLGRSRVAILRKQSVEEPSDIAGLIYIPFNERVDEVRAQLFKELQAAGYKPNPAAL